MHQSRGRGVVQQSRRTETVRSGQCCVLDSRQADAPWLLEFEKENFGRVCALEGYKLKVRSKTLTFSAVQLLKPPKPVTQPSQVEHIGKTKMVSSSSPMASKSHRRCRVSISSLTTSRSPSGQLPKAKILTSSFSSKYVLHMPLHESLSDPSPALSVLGAPHRLEFQQGSLNSAQS